jgi:uncharacterized protein YnzC (UPF0291/DUF896 family)
MTDTISMIDYLDMKAKAERLTAENEKLRATVKEMADLAGRDGPPDSINALNAIEEIGRQSIKACEQQGK